MDNEILTKKEKTICRLLGAKWVTRDSGSYVVELYLNRPKMNNSINVSVFDSGHDDWIADVDCKLFPSVKMGECICVEE